MTQVFKKFPSLENTYQQRFVNMVEDLGFAQQTFIVTEKVHGANFAFYSTGYELTCAKRTGMILKDEKFFNYRPVFAKYKDSLLALAKDLESTDVIIYGELFGGNIQTGMPYNGEQDFVAFDLVVAGRAINKVIAFDLLKKYNIPTVPVIGYYPNLDSAMALNESFTSLLALPEFEGAPFSEAEGLVIEPVEPKWYPSGSRVYFKKKTKRFLEQGGNKLPKPQAQLSEDIMETLITAQGYINENRFNSLVSKNGEFTIKDIGRATGLFVQDVLEDMHRDLVNCYDKLTDSSFTKSLNKEVLNFLRPILLQK